MEVREPDESPALFTYGKFRIFYEYNDISLLAIFILKGENNEHARKNLGDCGSIW